MLKTIDMALHSRQVKLNTHAAADLSQSLLELAVLVRELVAVKVRLQV